MLYSLHYKDNLIGLYDSLENVNNFLEGIENQKWENKKNFSINEFKKNSILHVRTIQFNKKINKESKDKIKKSGNYEKIEKDKIELHNKMEKLKKKIIEMKNMYDSDLNVFNALMKKKSGNDKFKIPPIFEEKYRVIELLKEKNNLNIENYYKLYKIENKNNCWSGLFNKDE
jgi:hypothetical protein